MYKWFYSLLSRGKIQLGEKIWVLSYTDKQGQNLKNEAKNFLLYKGKDALLDFNIEWYCYNAMPVDKYKLPRVIVVDEIDACITEQYHKNISKEIPYRLGLTATLSANSTVFKSKIDEQLYNTVMQSDKATKEGRVEDFINKGQLLEIVCPIVYKFTFEQGLEMGLASPYETTIINHNLDKYNKVIQIWKSKPEYLGTEYDYYSSRQRLIAQYQYPKYAKGRMARECSSFLYNLPSKRHVIKKLLSQLEGQTILFGVNLPLLSMCTENVIYDDNPSSFTLDNVYYTIKRTKKKTAYIKKHMLRIKSKEISKEVYQKAKNNWKSSYKGSNVIMEQFNKGEISVISSAKAIGRGVTLGQVDNIIVASYYSQSVPFMQWFYRSRFAEGKTTQLYFIRTKNTYEDKRWFDKLNKEFDEKGKLVKEFNLNIKQELNFL